MIRFEPFRAGHLKVLTPQATQSRELAQIVSSGQAHQLETSVAISGWVGVRCVGAAGLIPVFPHKAVAWAVLSADAGPYMLAIARKVRRVIAASPYKRVEVSVAEGFEAGHRFAQAVGAVRETPEPLRFYGADGGNEVLYSILSEGD